MYVHVCLITCSLSITTSSCGSRMYFGMCIHDCSYNIPFYYIAVLEPDKMLINLIFRVPSYIYILEMIFKIIYN